MMKGIRIGAKMLSVLFYVRSHPGCYMYAAAKHVGPHGSHAFGYQTVHRAIKAGLVRQSPGSRRGTYILFANPSVL